MPDTVYDLARHWLFEDALPFWAKHGVDRINGGFVEHLRLDGTRADIDFKRVRVVARQIYVFSHASLLGFPEALEVARHGQKFLTERAWLGPTGGWARLLDNRGNVIDSTPDLYDIAFVMFALGWLQLATQEPEPAAWSIRTLNFVESWMRAGATPGFMHEKPPRGPRLQNPHMHLLEAALVNLVASGNPRFRNLVEELIDLCLSRFSCSDTYTVAEYYDEEWVPAGGEAGQLREPGHQFEWAWLLAKCQLLTGRDLSAYIRRLVSFAESYGVDPCTGLTFNSVREDGVVINRASRVWPNTERLQAAVALFEIDGRDPRPIFDQSCSVLFERFLSHQPKGTWLDQITSDGAPNVDKIPASTLYHLMIAFAEMLRVEKAVVSAFPP